MERRKEILNYIRNRPGITFRELARELGLGIGDLQYHLGKLEKEGQVFSRRAGRRRYIFPAGFEEDAQRLLMAISTETRRQILLLLMKGPMSQGEIAEKLGVSQPTVSYHMKELEKLGIVRAERTGKSIIYRINYDPEALVRLIREYRPTLWERLADGLIDFLAGVGEG
ncbi:regulatory protein [Thermococcus eurythermalis]|uniref:Regulatory protein n=1 Tax=Thermococcus eurythermalis TaxID=1505907 RepID=A0A097QRH2_9EURY|nr:metalloregulator ArsR/SmtB family transcription factor [Thermococcus eurythermalis]AIU69079.1 regulatory protein [Thermococcus eurythermalis]